MDSPPTKLFVWRHGRHYLLNEELPSIYAGFSRGCPWCGGVYNEYSYNTGCDRDRRPRQNHFFTRSELEERGWSSQDGSGGICASCGFEFERDRIHHPGGEWDDVALKCLCALNLNDSRLGLDELGTHFRRRKGGIHSLSPRRFEELVCDVYRNLGYQTQLTQMTRDGGYDILLQSAEGEKILVECKRYAATRKVGVSIIREVLGVQVIRGVPEARIVTTSEFSETAKREAVQARNSEYALHLALVDINRLLVELEVYDRALPPLQMTDLFAERECSNGDQPATNKQIGYLKVLGVDVPDDCTKQHASELIDEHSKGA